MNALAADGPDSGTFEVLARGRRFPQLVARLGEISDYVTKLGAAGPYSHFYHGHEVPLNNSVLPQLQPYMPLDANRLSIKGHGCFDATPHLGDELLMAYRMPDLLLCDRQPQYGDFPIMTDDATQIIQLAKMWDARGLLFLRRGPVEAESLTRMFNNFKNEECDRQIGDRRGRNYQEAKVYGPSRHVPAGSDLTDLHLDGRKEALYIYCTDRSDFYHQFAVTDAKAAANAVGPPVTAADVADLHAYSEMLSREANEKKVKRTREVEGDQLHLLHEPSDKKRASLLSDEIFICFKSLFQGDHGGVEFATASHESVLQSQGLLSSSTRLVANRPFRGGPLADGLVIDDYFAISREPRRLAPEQSAAARYFSQSQAVYKKYDLIGSPQKDVIGEKRARVIGAEINSNDHAARRGITSVGSPIGKRLSLSWVTFQIAQLPATTDSLHLCLLGGWTSMILYRRPFMSLLTAVHKLVDAASVDADAPKTVALPRSVANELCLMSVLAPLMVSDIAADFSEEIFATDPSNTKGAIVSTTTLPSVAQELWRCCRTKGAYSRLKTDYELLVERLGIAEDVGEDVNAPPAAFSGQRPAKPIAFKFDFIEIYAGSARVSSAASSMGLVVGPPVDIAYSGELDLSLVRVISWLSYMVTSGLLGSLMVEPVCTTFSIIRRPRLRSSSVPLGFDPRDPKTHLGNVLALRALTLLFLAHRYGVPALGEQPWSSMMRFLPSWRALEEKPGVRTMRSDSCAFGSVHLKSFRFIAVHLGIDRLNRRCSGDHSHIPVEGRYTKASASYTHELAHEIAACFAEAVAARKNVFQAEESRPVDGLENQLVNLVATSSSWKARSAWSFQTERRINVLEMKSVVRLAERLIGVPRPLRVVNFVDSYVIRCAASKGRSSSIALSPFLRKFGALSVAGGLYFTLPFVPTRHSTTRQTIPLGIMTFGRVWGTSISLRWTSMISDSCYFKGLETLGIKLVEVDTWVVRIPWLAFWKAWPTLSWSEVDFCGWPS